MGGLHLGRIASLTTNWGIVYWRHQRAQWEYVAHSPYWIWLGYVMILLTGLLCDNKNRWAQSHLFFPWKSCQNKANGISLTHNYGNHCGPEQSIALWNNKPTCQDSNRGFPFTHILIAWDTFVSAKDLWSHNLWKAHSLGAELHRVCVKGCWGYFLSLKVTIVRIFAQKLHPISTLCETCTNNHLQT